jgi:hypothetical protein
MNDIKKCSNCDHFLGQHVIRDNGRIHLNWSQYLRTCNHIREGCYIKQCRCTKFLVIR